MTQKRKGKSLAARLYCSGGGDSNSRRGQKKGVFNSRISQLWRCSRSGQVQDCLFPSSIAWVQSKWRRAETGKALGRNVPWKLGYCIEFWTPHWQRDRLSLDCILRTVTRMERALRGTPQEKWLKGQKMFTLEERRLWMGRLIVALRIPKHSHVKRQLDVFQWSPEETSGNEKWSKWPKWGRLFIFKSQLKTINSF